MAMLHTTRANWSQTTGVVDEGRKLARRAGPAAPEGLGYGIDSRLDGNGQLPRAGHRLHDNVGLLDATGQQLVLGALQQRLNDGAVPARVHNADAQAGAVMLLRGRAFEGRVRHVCWWWLARSCRVRVKRGQHHVVLSFLCSWVRWRGLAGEREREGYGFGGNCLSTAAPRERGSSASSSLQT
jgi:hypothetical protein